jgi:hypothetical protein
MSYKKSNHTDSNNNKSETPNIHYLYTFIPDTIKRSNSNLKGTTIDQKGNQQPYCASNSSGYSNANNSNSESHQIKVLDKSKAINNNNPSNLSYNGQMNNNNLSSSNNNNNDNNNNNNNNKFMSHEEFSQNKKKETEACYSIMNKTSESERKNNPNFKYSHIKNSIYPCMDKFNNSKNSNLINNSIISNISNKNQNDDYDFSKFWGLNKRENIYNPSRNSYENKNANFNYNDVKRPTTTNNNINQGHNDSKDYYNGNLSLNDNTISKGKNELRNNTNERINIDNHNQRNNSNNFSNASLRGNSFSDAKGRFDKDENNRGFSRNPSAVNKDNYDNNSLYSNKNSSISNNKFENLSSKYSKPNNNSLYEYTEQRSNNIKNLSNNQNLRSISAFSGYDNNSNKDAYFSNNKNQDSLNSSNLDRLRHNITDIYGELDTNTKNSALKFFKAEDSNNNNNYNKNKNNSIYERDVDNDNFEKKIGQYGNITKSIYFDDDDYINQMVNTENVPLSESILKENHTNNNSKSNKNSSIYDNSNINNNNNYPKNNSLSNNKNNSNYNYSKVNTECLNDIIGIISKNNSISEIKNEKIFSSSSISKSYSNNVEDYVQVQETKINKNTLFSFFEILNKKYEAILDLFYMDFKKCSFSNSEKQLNKIGPISSLELYIQCKFSGFLKANEPILAISLLENNIFRWRNISGDGNCFYRAVMFSYLEDILIHNKDFEFLNFIKEIFDFTQKAAIKKIFEKNNIDFDFLIRSLFFILYIKTSGKINYPHSKYEMLIILINNCRDIDLGLVLYLRIKIFEFIENNKNKIYSQDFNVKMGNLLSEKYQVDEENFEWQLFYEENLLKLYTEAENIIIYVTPLILQINLKIFTYDIGNEDKFRIISCGLPDKHTAFVFYRKIHYDLIYSKEHFEKIQNNFVNYFDTDLPVISVEKLKIQAQQELKRLSQENENFEINKNTKEMKVKIQIDDLNIIDINSQINNNKNNNRSKNNTVVENPYLIDLSHSINNNNNNDKINSDSVIDKVINLKKNKNDYIENGSEFINYNDNNNNYNQIPKDLILEKNNKQFVSNKNLINLNSTEIYRSINSKKQENMNIPCSICQEEIDFKISNFINKALCLNCFTKELKSVLSIKISPKIEESIVQLLKEKGKSFKHFNEIFQLDDNEQLTVFNYKGDFKLYKEFLQINLEEIIKKILKENCLICFYENQNRCQPKKFIMLPCSCSFYSLRHFKLFIKNLIKINVEEKKLINFTCLCNTKYSVIEILKIFEVINENKLDEEFYALKNFLMENYFKRLCCNCGVILKNKKVHIFKDNMIGIFMHVTTFEHFACDNCEESLIKAKRKQKEINKPLVFPCNICNFEHLFEK